MDVFPTFSQLYPFHKTILLKTGMIFIEKEILNLNLKFEQVRGINVQKRRGGRVLYSNVKKVSLFFNIATSKLIENSDFKIF